MYGRLSAESFMYWCTMYHSQGSWMLSSQALLPLGNKFLSLPFLSARRYWLASLTLPVLTLCCQMLSNVKVSRNKGNLHLSYNLSKVSLSTLQKRKLSLKNLMFFPRSLLGNKMQAEIRTKINWLQLPSNLCLAVLLTLISFSIKDRKV